MNFNTLTPFIEKSAESKNIKLRKLAETLNDSMLKAEEAEEIQEPMLHGQEANEPLNDRPKDEVDKVMESFLPDIKTIVPNGSTFGKSASSYTADVSISSLPKDTIEDIQRFIPSAKLKDKVIKYNMVVDELIPKVDHHNFDSAEKHIKNNIDKKGKRIVADEFHQQMEDKYILLLNDHIIDGHHFLSKAKELGISCGLNVLDLNPLRFQTKQASLFHKLAYVLYHDSRKSAA